MYVFLANYLFNAKQNEEHKSIKQKPINIVNKYYTTIDNLIEEYKYKNIKLNYIYKVGTSDQSNLNFNAMTNNYKLFSLANQRLYNKYNKQLKHIYSQLIQDKLINSVYIYNRYSSDLDNMYNLWEHYYDELYDLYEYNLDY